MQDSIHKRLRGSLQNCKHKRSYKTYEYAVQKAIHYTEKFGTMQYVYYCSLCGRYHLTSHRQREGRELEIYEARVKQELERRKQDGKTDTGSTSLRDVPTQRELKPDMHTESTEESSL